MPLEDWVRHSRHDMFLYDWQTLIAGVLALLAGFGTIWVTRHIANRQIAETRKQTETTVRLERERVASEREAIRIALAEEIWWLLRHLLEVHKGLRELSVLSPGWSASVVRDYASLREPVIYPAIAGKIGFIPKLAPYLVAFYGSIEHLRSHVRTATADPAQTLNSRKLDAMAEQFELAFQENALELSQQLPELQANTELKEMIEAMGRTPASPPGP